MYQGCYGFSWTFTHDSYSYTGFCEDNSQGVCPDCEGTHEHMPYQSGGTNECGLSVTATESQYGNDSVTSVDPFIDTGIEEAEITELRDRTQELVYTEWESVQEEVLHSGDHASEIATQGSIAIIEQVFQNVSLPVESYR